jgi:hypothetical protein
MTANNTFKFHDDTVNNSWNSGTWYVADGDNIAPVGSLSMVAQSSSGANNAWKTVDTGNYTIALNITSGKVTFTPIPEVTGITVSGPETVVPGQNSYTYTAAVTAYHGASTVTWTLTGNKKDTTTLVEDPADNNKATLTVAAGETGPLTITAASTLDGTVKDSKTVTVVAAADSTVYLIGAAILDGESEWPATPGTAADKAMTKEAEGKWTWTGMMRGDKTFKFHDNTVTGWNDGTWYVANGTDVSTDAEESRTVKKTDSSDGGGAWKTAVTGKYKITLDTAKLTVTFTPIPEVTGITVNGPETVAPGQSNYTYTAAVTAYHGASQDVTWTLTENETGTSISDAGVLTVAAGETGPLTITATSTLDGTVKGSKTVAVVDSAVYLIGTDFDGGWPETPGAASGLAADSKAGNTFTWNNVFMTANSTFKFHDDTVNNSWESGTWYVADGTDVSTAGTEPKTVTKSNSSGTDGAWKTAAEGKYTIVLNITSEPKTVTFTPIPEVTGIIITASASAAAQGGTLTFTAAVTATHAASKAVAWTVTGKNASNQEVAVTSGTAITGSGPDNNTGTLTVAVNETAAKLVVTATSTYTGFTDMTGTSELPVKTVLEAVTETWATQDTATLQADAAISSSFTIPAGKTLIIEPGKKLTAGKIVLDAGIWKATNADVTLTTDTITLGSHEYVGFGNEDGSVSAVLTGRVGTANTYTATGTGVVTMGQNNNGHSLTITGTTSGDTITLGATARIFVRKDESVTITNAKLVTGAYLDLGPGIWKATGGTGGGAHITTNTISLEENVGFGNGDGSVSAVLVGDGASKDANSFIGSGAKITLGQNNNSLTITGSASGDTLTLGATARIYVKPGEAVTITNATLAGQYLALGAGTWKATTAGVDIKYDAIQLGSTLGVTFGKDDAVATVLAGPHADQTGKPTGYTVYAASGGRVTISQSGNDLVIAGENSGCILDLWSTAGIEVKSGLTITTATVKMVAVNDWTSVLYLHKSVSGITLSNINSKIEFNLESEGSGAYDLTSGIKVPIAVGTGIAIRAVWNNAWEADKNRFASFTGADTDNTITASGSGDPVWLTKNVKCND